MSRYPCFSCKQKDGHNIDLSPDFVHLTKNLLRLSQGGRRLPGAQRTGDGAEPDGRGRRTDRTATPSSFRTPAALLILREESRVRQSPGRLLQLGDDRPDRPDEGLATCLGPLPLPGSGEVGGVGDDLEPVAGLACTPKDTPFLPCSRWQAPYIQR